MLTVTLDDIQIRIRLLQARREFLAGATQSARNHTLATLYTGETVGIDKAIVHLGELAAFFKEPGELVSESVESSKQGQEGT